MSGYLDGELSSRARSRLERHTDECPDCRGVVRELSRMLAMLRRLPSPTSSTDASEIAAVVRRRLHEPPGR